MEDKKKREMRIKIVDEVLKGVYANSMMVTHTKEEFMLDFINNFPPEGIVNARVIISPGHLKRVIKALQNNMAEYEKSFGEISEASAPESEKMGFVH